MIDPYKVLGLEKTATAEEVKKAYKKAAKQHHPDSNSGDAEAFKEVQEAYDILGDPVKRSMFDSGNWNMHARKRGAPQPQQNPMGSAFQEVMEEFFGGTNFKGRNIQLRLEIEFKEVLTGCTKQFNVKKRKKCTGCAGQGFTGFTPCSHCSGQGFTQTPDPSGFMMQMQSCQVCGGTGKANVVKCGDCAGQGFLPGYIEKMLTVEIPAGIHTGMQIRIAGEGEDAIRVGGRTGDVIIFVLVKDHHLFQRDGSNILLEVPISYTQLALGGEIEVPTLKDGNMNIKIPAGSQSHTKFRVKGKGFPDGRGGVGDLLATVKIETPKQLNDNYKKLLEELAELEKNNITPRREQWEKDIKK